MNRSHAIFLFSGIGVAIGSAAALSAWLLQGAREGTLPRAALALPAETRFLLGVDARRLVASPLYKRYAQAVLAGIKAKTGLDPEHDIDTILLGGSGMSPSSSVAIVRGRVQLDKVAQAVGQSPNRGFDRGSLAGKTLFSYQDAQGNSMAVAVFDETTVLAGGGEIVKKVLQNASSSPLRSNVPLMALVGRVRKGATLWAVGDSSLLSMLPQSLGSGSFGSLTLPTLRGLLATCEFDPVVALEVVAEADDPAAAKNLADLVRGGWAMLSLQAAQRPELQALPSAVNVTNDQNRVLLNARIPYELIDALRAPQASR